MGVIERENKVSIYYMRKKSIFNRRKNRKEMRVICLP